MKTVLRTFCVLVALVSTPSLAEGELVLFNWHDYLDPEVLADFSREHNIKVKEVFFESDDERDRLMAEVDGSGFDLVMVNGVLLRDYREFGWIEDIPQQKVPNLKHVERKWLREFEIEKNAAVPFLWGTTGIAYNSDFFPNGVDSWSALFEPAEAHHGKVALVRSSRDVIGMALKYRGYSANSESVDALKEVEKLLLTQKKTVKGYSYILGGESSLISGDVVVAMMYSGDALSLREDDERIQYVLPKEGGNIWVDYLAVTSKGRNKDNAYKFLDYINRPKVAARVAKFAYGPTPNKSAEKYLEKEFLNDPFIYPEEQSLQRSEIYLSLSNKALRERNRVFSKLGK